MFKDILTRPVAQTDAYDILLSKANDERIKMSRQEKGTQTEALDFHAQVQQPIDQRHHYTTVNHHQQTTQTIPDIVVVGIGDPIGTELILVKTITMLETDLIIMTEIDDGVMVNLNITEVINGHLLQGIRQRVKL